MDWREEYNSKMTTAAEAVSRIKSGDRVSFTYGVEAQDLGLALAARLGEVENVTIFLPSPSRDFGWYDPGWEMSFNIELAFLLPVVRDIMAEKRCDYAISSMLWQTDADLRPIDVLFIEVSPPDDNGFCSFGASVWGKKRLMDKAGWVIAEVNEKLIRTYGENYVHISEFDQFVPHTPTGTTPGGTDLLGRKTEDPGPIVRSIAEHVSGLIRDRDTLQIGVGSSSEWIVRLGALDNKRDLGWHSETTPQGVVRLVREGVITGKYKNIHTGKVVATAIGGGTKEEMDFVRMNPIFELYDGEYILDPRVVSAHDNMVAINSGVAVDLTGQISAESIGHNMVSGTGGQLAFAVGAQLSRGGRSIVVMPSTAKSGTVSRITMAFEPGTIVSVPRTLSDLVVTEYGVASLRAKTQRERAQALIDIAHPDFRKELERDAQRLFYP